MFTPEKKRFQIDPEQFAVRSGNREGELPLVTVTVMCMYCDDFNLLGHDMAEFQSTVIDDEPCQWVDLKPILEWMRDHKCCNCARQPDKTK